MAPPSGLMPGPFPYLIFYLWIPITAILFSQKKPREAAFIVVIWGTLLLPELIAVDPPILPYMDKHNLVCACGFAGLFLTAKSRWQRMQFLKGVQLFFVFLAVCNVGTALTNPETFVYGGQPYWPDWEESPVAPVLVIPALSPKEFIPMGIDDFFKFLIPFGVGQMLIQSREDAILFFKSYALSALIYMPFMLWEGVMSPQLHYQVYGYFSLPMGHNIRGDGFKPIVLTCSGLGLVMLQYVGMACAIALYRAKQNVHALIPAGIAVIALVFNIAVSRSVGVLFYVAATVPLMMFMGPRIMTRVSWVLIVIFLTFPITRAKDWFPADDIIAYAEAKNPKRAQSLGMRFDNEKMLIDHTDAKPYFGWGSYGRNRIYKPETGEDISVTDGEWAIHYSVRGAFGVISWFWMMALPVLWACRVVKWTMDKEDKVILGIMTLTAAMNAVDLLPNSSFTKVPIIWSGMLAGYLQYLTRKYKPNKK